MLLVPTYVAPSPIHGVGVFAAERIPAGTTIWTFAEGLDLVVPDERIALLPPLSQRFLEIYAFRAPFWSGGLVLCFDHSRFINHAAPANTDNRSALTYARRDIEKGEEITCDYGELCTDFCGGFEP